MKTAFVIVLCIITLLPLLYVLNMYLGQEYFGTNTFGSEFARNDYEPSGFWRLDDNDNEETEARNMILRIIDVEFDKDHNGLLSQLEVAEWITRVQKQLIDYQVRLQFVFYAEGSSEISLQSIKKPLKPMDQAVALTRALRRFEFADRNGDSNLDILEFRDFLYPADELLVAEILDNLDENLNSQLSLLEVAQSLNQSQAVLYDRDNDGLLNGNEIKEWLLPSAESVIAGQVSNLFSCDSDMDGSLNRDEVNDNYFNFIPYLPVDFNSISLYGAQSKEEVNEVNVVNEEDELSSDGARNIELKGDEKIFGKMSLNERSDL